MQVSFALTYEDLEESLQTHLKTEKDVPSLSPGSTVAPNTMAVVKPAEARGAVKFSRSMLGWLLILGMAILLFVLFHKEPGGPRGAGGGAVAAPEEGVFFRTLVNLLPYALIFAFIYLGFLRRTKQSKKARDRYNSDPFHLQERTLELLQSGIRISAPNERHEFDWLGYQRVVESEHLILLYTGPLMFQVLPKRAFAAPEELHAFLRIVREKVPDRRAGAFPVMGAAAQPLGSPEDVTRQVL